MLNGYAADCLDWEKDTTRIFSKQKRFLSIDSSNGEFDDSSSLLTKEPQIFSSDEFYQWKKWFSTSTM